MLLVSNPWSYTVHVPVYRRHYSANHLTGVAEGGESRHEKGVEFTFAGFFFWNSSNYEHNEEVFMENISHTPRQRRS